MRRALLFSFVVLFAWAGVAVAQEESAGQEVENITHGQFAILLLKASAGYTDALPTEVDALDLVKRWELVPADWQVDDVLTHGELADVLEQFGIVHVPADRDKPVSRPFAEAILRRELSRLRDYLARRMGHGISINHVLDLGVDRAVSPSTFD